MKKIRIEFSPQEISEALKKIRIERNTQFGKIAEEILKNIGDFELDDSQEKDFYICQTLEVIDALRSSYTKDDEIAGILSSSKDVFNEDVIKIDPVKQEKAKALYKTFWKHTNIANLIAINDLHKNEYDELEVSDLENAAAWYLSYDWMKSKTLNWLFIDALLFAENVSFAQSIVPYTNNQWDKFIKSLLFPIIGEGFNLFITGIVSSFIANISNSNGYSGNNQDIIFWIIFSTITIGRWLNPSKVFDQKTINNKLLISMISVYGSKLKNPNFHPDLLKKMLYDLEIKGAVYSPNIYFILEKKY